MSNFIKTFDDILIYKGSSICRVQIFRRDGVFYLVVFTELELNTGSSVTNSIEELIKIAEETILGTRLNREQDIILYAERYEQHPEYFEWVQIGSNKHPIWTRATAEEIRTILPLIG